MSAKVTVYIFFKTGNVYQYVKDNELYTFSNEMMNCLRHQYELQSFIMEESNDYITFSRIENAIELFIEKMNRIGKGK